MVCSSWIRMQSFFLEISALNKRECATDKTCLDTVWKTKAAQKSAQSKDCHFRLGAVIPDFTEWEHGPKLVHWEISPVLFNENNPRKEDCSLFYTDLSHYYFSKEGEGSSSVSSCKFCIPVPSLQGDWAVWHTNELIWRSAHLIHLSLVLVTSPGKLIPIKFRPVPTWGIWRQCLLRNMPCLISELL